MGNGKLSGAVLDSGPLIHLTEIGCLRFLNIFDILYVAHAVWLETVGKSRISQNELPKETDIQQVLLSPPEVTQFVQENGLIELHAGEQECFICAEKGAYLLC